MNTGIDTLIQNLNILKAALPNENTEKEKTSHDAIFMDVISSYHDLVSKFPNHLRTRSISSSDQVTTLSAVDDQQIANIQTNLDNIEARVLELLQAIRIGANSRRHAEHSQETKSESKVQPTPSLKVKTEPRHGDHSIRIASISQQLSTLTDTLSTSFPLDETCTKFLQRVYQQIDYERSLHLARSQASSATKDLAKERAKSMEEESKREKWKSDIGARLAAMHEEVKNLKIENGELHFDLQKMSEFAHDWKERGQIAVSEKELLLRRSERAQQLEQELEATKSVLDKTREELDRVRGQIDENAPSILYTSLQAATYKELSTKLEKRQMKLGNALKLAKIGHQESQTRCLMLEEENRRLEQKISNLEKLNTSQKAYRDATESIYERRYKEVSRLNITLSEWFLELQARKGPFEHG